MVFFYLTPSCSSFVFCYVVLFVSVLNISFEKLLLRFWWFTSKTFQDLEQLAAELRADIVYSVSKTEGHLSSSLGVIELSVALHHVFNAPDDKIIWDVGHQVEILNNSRRISMLSLELHILSSSGYSYDQALYFPGMRT